MCGTTGARGGLDGPVATATFDTPVMAIESETGDIYVLCSGGSTIRRLDCRGNVTTLCGRHGVAGSTDSPTESERAAAGSGRGVEDRATLNRPFHMTYVAYSFRRSTLVPPPPPTLCLPVSTNPLDARRYVARSTLVSEAGTLFVADNGGSVRSVSTSGTWSEAQCSLSALNCLPVSTTVCLSQLSACLNYPRTERRTGVLS